VSIGGDDLRVVTRSLLSLTELAQRQDSALSSLTQTVAQLAATSAQIATALLRVEARVENLATAQSARASAHSGEISAIRVEVANAVATLATCQTSPPVNTAAGGASGAGRPASARPAGRYRGPGGEQTIIGLAPPANPPPGPPPRPKRASP